MNHALAIKVDEKHLERSHDSMRKESCPIAAGDYFLGNINISFEKL